MESIKMRKWWWAWNYESIEAWLEEQALNGYILTKTTGFGGCVFHFNRTAPKKIRYCVDYQDKLTPEYIRLLTEDGWSYCKIPGSWIACWKEYDDIRPQLFNDYDTIIDRNNKLLTTLSCLFLPAVGLLSLFRGNIIETEIIEIPALMIFFGVTVFYVFAIASLSSANTVLKKKKALQNK